MTIQTIVGCLLAGAAAWSALLADKSDKVADRFFTALYLAGALIMFNAH